MSIALSSKRYAQAIFQIAKEHNDFDLWHANLKKISDIMNNPSLAYLLDNPKIHFEQKEKIIREALNDIDPLAINLALMLVLKNKFRNASQISAEYDSLHDESKGIKRATFTTAFEPNKDEKIKYTQQIEKLTGTKLIIDFQVDPKIIGGFIARIDGTLINGSVLNKLELLRNQIGKYGK